jgi:3,4-dihydroxy 2-butanone 4-phosphate synthase/GTP cyclohydrolase II
VVEESNLQCRPCTDEIERRVTPPLSPRRDRLRLTRGEQTRMPTAHGNFDAVCYTESSSGLEHLVLTKGDVGRAQAPLVRAHSECATGDIFGSRRCDCGEQLQRSLQLIAASDAGCLIYLRGHEGRGIGLGAKLTAYALQDQGRDTIEANEDQGLPVDGREYDAVARVLNDLNVDAVRLLTNNPAKVEALEALGVKVLKRVPVLTEPTPENYRYLKTKQDRMGHELGLLD